MIKIIKLFIPVYLFFVVLNPVFAVTTGSGSDTSCNEQGCTLTNPLAPAGIESIPQLIGQIIKTLLGISGSLALVMFIYGGFLWMTAAGNADGVKKGKDILIWATIGLVVIFSAYGLVKLVFTSLGVTV